MGIDRFDVTIIQKDNLIKQNAQSIGIDEIKNIQKKIFLKPINSPEKAVVIEEAHLLTHAAQNALLKVLEEPPDNTYLVLCTDSVESLLPTILSRCKAIWLEAEKTSITDAEKQEFLEFIDNLPRMKVGDMLKSAENLTKNMDATIEWLGKLIVILREKMLETHNAKNVSSFVKAFQELHTLLKTTNVNPRMAMENTLLSLNS